MRRSLVGREFWKVGFQPCIDPSRRDRLAFEVDDTESCVGSERSPDGDDFPVLDPEGALVDHDTWFDGDASVGYQEVVDFVFRDAYIGFGVRFLSPKVRWPEGRRPKDRESEDQHPGFGFERL